MKNIHFCIALAGTLFFSRAGTGQAQKSSRPLPAREPIPVTAGQTQIRSLEKWTAGQAVVTALPEPRTARLLLRPEQIQTDPIQKGQAVRVALGPPRSGYLSGVVDLVSASPGSRAGPVRVEMLVENPASALAAGQTCFLEILVVKRPNSLVAPRGAIISQGRQAFVFRLDRGSGRARAQKVEVHLGYATDQWAEVKAGLWSGQWLATSNLDDLSDGAVVFAQPNPR